MPNSTTYRKSGATANYPLVGGISLKSTTDIDDGWYHIAVTLKRGGTAVMYINGEPEATIGMYNYSYEQYPANTYFGAISFGDVGSESVYSIDSKCYLDDYCAWKLELTRDDITSIYNSGSPTDLRLAGSYHTDGAIKINNLINYYIMEAQGGGGAYITDSTYSMGGAYEDSAQLLLIPGTLDVEDEVPGDSSFSTKSLVFDGDDQYAKSTGKHRYGINSIGASLNAVNTDFTLSFWFKWDDGHPETFSTNRNYIMGAGDISQINYDNMVLKFNNSDKKIEYIFNGYQA